ncbi:MAG: SDR family oxidoreductase [Clostridiales bacterium]|nr:SDR family oxidoreductase [Clostridiales bacterium]
MNWLSCLKKAVNLVRPKKIVTAEIKLISPNSLLAEKNIVITGGSRGLGYAIAERCISEGARVLITGRSEKALMEEANKLGDNCRYIVRDVSDVSNLSGFLAEAEQTLGKIDCLVSNAGISLHEGDFHNVTEAGWDAQININLKGNYFMCKAFISYLESNKKQGNILVVTSERSLRTDDLPYGLSKTASNSFIKCFASKIIDKGIRINGIAPGVTATEMTGFNKDGSLYAEFNPSKRVFLPEEVAQTAVFLLSEASACISGEIIACDQGRYITHW